MDAYYYVLMGALVVLFAYIAWTKPICGPGFVPSLAVGNGWVCLQGYKP